MYEETRKCEWCEEEFDASQLLNTDIGYICEHCFAAIRSRGEPIIVFYD